jgi:hypothetical protein
MARGIIDTNYIDFPDNIDQAYLSGLQTRSGLSFTDLAARMDAALAGLNAGIDPMLALLLAPPTTSAFSQGGRTGTMTAERRGQHTLPRPQQVARQAHMLAIAGLELALGFTEDGLQAISLDDFQANVDAMVEALERMFRADVLYRLFSDDEFPVAGNGVIQTTATSPGFAGSGTGSNAFAGVYPDGTALGGGYTHYYRDATANRAAVIKSARDRLRRWHEPPFDLIGSATSIDGGGAGGRGDLRRRVCQRRPGLAERPRLHRRPLRALQDLRAIQPAQPAGDALRSAQDARRLRPDAGVLPARRVGRALGLRHQRQQPRRRGADPDRRVRQLRRADDRRLGRSRGGRRTVTASYANTLPTDKDWVRWKLADTGSEVDEETDAPIWLRQDEEIDAVLAIYPDRRVAAAELADSLYREVSAKADSYGDPTLNVRWSQRATAFRDIARILREQVASASTATGPSFGSAAASRPHHAAHAEYLRPIDPCWPIDPHWSDR